MGADRAAQEYGGDTEKAQEAKDNASGTRPRKCTAGGQTAKRANPGQILEY